MSTLLPTKRAHVLISPPPRARTKSTQSFQTWYINPSEVVDRHHATGISVFGIDLSCRVWDNVLSQVILLVFVDLTLCIDSSTAFCKSLYIRRITGVSLSVWLSVYPCDRLLLNHARMKGQRLPDHVLNQSHPRTVIGTLKFSKKIPNPNLQP